MRQQTVRLLDPNSVRHNQEFSTEGRHLISVLRKNGVDKEVRDQMRVYLAAKESAFKKTAMHKEATQYGHPSMALAFGAETVGIYNPDTIPIDTYNKMKTDPQIAIGLSVIKLPLYALGWQVECDDVDIREFVKEALTPVWRKLIKSMLTAVDYGFASHELVWELRDLQVTTQTATGRKKTHYNGKAEVYKKIKPHYPTTIKIRVDSKTDEFLGVTQSAGFGGTDVKLDFNKAFLFSLGDEFGNYFGTSRMKPAYKPWYWKEVLMQFMLRYFERKGSPSTLVTHPIGGGIDVDGNEYDNSEIALRIGSNLLENSVVTLPYEVNREGKNKWAAEFLSDDKRGEMFVDVLNYLGTQVLRALLTPERVMTQDLSTGSFSMASSHAEIFLLSEEGLATSLESAINERIVPPLVEFNFQPNKVIPCRVRIEKIQYDRRRILKEILVEIIRNINNWAKLGKAPNLMPSIKEMSEVLGVPLMAMEEEYTDADLNPVGTGAEVGDSGRPKKEPASQGKVEDINKNKKVKRNPATVE